MVIVRTVEPDYPIEPVVMMDFIDMGNLMYNDGIGNFLLIGKQTVIELPDFLLRPASSVVGLEETGSDCPGGEVYSHSSSDFSHPLIQIQKEILLIPGQRILCILRKVVEPFAPLFHHIIREVAFLPKMIDIDIFFPKRTLGNLLLP